MRTLIFSNDVDYPLILPKRRNKYPMHWQIMVCTVQPKFTVEKRTRNELTYRIIKYAPLMQFR